jgi:hypothetical protein
MMRWHYTVGFRLANIQLDGYIKTATAAVSRHERSAVWFTSSPDWEPSANRLWRSLCGTLICLTREQTQARGGRLVRIGVVDDYPLLTWDELCREAHMKVGEKRRLLHAAQQWGSDPQNDWWGTFERVFAKDWAAVETFEENRWLAQ